MDINKINKTLGGIAIFLIISLFLQKVIMDIIAYSRFDWEVGVVTSENYPVQIVECTRYSPDYHQKIVRNIWGDRLNTTDHNAYDERLPKRFGIKWYSYNEDQFFEASIPLPSDSLDYFAKKYRKHSQNENKERGFYSDYYTLILVAELKPNGMVSVWLTNDYRNGERIELYSDFQGIEANLDESELNMYEGFTRKEWNEIITTRKYNWKIVPAIEELHQIKEIDANTYANVSYDCVADHESSLKYIPNYIRMKWHGNEGKSYSTFIQFQAKEISHLFAELYEGADNLQQSEIIIKFDRYFKEKHDSTDVRTISNPDKDYYDVAITLLRGGKSLQINTIYSGAAIEN